MFGEVLLQLNIKTNNMTQQTAVEWLLLNLEVPFPKINEYKLIIELAKQMEKEQIRDCWEVAHQAGRFEGKGIAEKNWQTGEQYYNETYLNK